MRILSDAEKKYIQTTKKPWDEYLAETLPYWDKYEAEKISYAEFKEATKHMRVKYDSINEPAMITALYHQNKELKEQMWELRCKLSIEQFKTYDDGSKQLNFIF